MEPKLAPGLKPPPVVLGSSFRDRLRRGEVNKAADNKVTIHLPLEADDNYFIIKIPRTLDYSQLRTKDAFTDDAGKHHKESAMLTINTVGLKDAAYNMSFVDEENGTRLDMAARPNVTLNLSMDYGTVQLFDAENGNPIASAE